MTRAAILIQALSGRGKTFKSAEGGKPLYLAPEPKCRLTVKAINPEANVIPLDTLIDFNKAIALVQKAELVEKGYTRIVLDSYSELTELMPEWLQMGFPLQIQDYGTIGNKAMELVRALLKAPIPVVIISRSEAKEQGKVHRIVPGSLGKSAGSLPAKCILTAETRFDDNLGWVVDTNPDEYTQRAGLPWVPTIFQGTMDEFLALIEAGPQADTVTTAKRIEAARMAADALEAERLAALPAPKTAGEVISQMAPPAAIEISQEVVDFVDGISPAVKVEMASNDDCAELLDLAAKHKVDAAKLLAYAAHKGWAPIGNDKRPNWLSITAEGHPIMKAFLSNDTKRRGLQAHLVEHFQHIAD